VFVVSRCDRFWCETGAVIAVCLRLRETAANTFAGGSVTPMVLGRGVLRSGGSFRPLPPPEATADQMRQSRENKTVSIENLANCLLVGCWNSNLGMAESKSDESPSGSIGTIGTMGLRRHGLDPMPPMVLGRWIA
jgi:hypothetical protein